MDYKKFFNKILLEQDDLPTRPRHDTDPSAISDEFLDQETDPSALDIEGMPEELDSVVERVAQQIINDASELERLAKRLIDPNNPGAILTKLASPDIASIPEFTTAAEQAAKSLKKAQPALQTAITDMNVLATLAKNRRDARISKETGPSGPR